MLFNYLFFLEIIIVLYTVFESNVFGSINIFKRMIGFYFSQHTQNGFLGHKVINPILWIFLYL